ncbi:MULTISPECIES: aldo/keto reductase [unclassified Luteibacter]|uniref:aldo/keto reductase n=1 Tax=Luteibacter sp. PvP019 TaxID=3156436 RepID=UPI00339A726C
MSTRLNDYLTLGRSGLRVSPVSLGTMTFGDDWGWGAAEAESRRMLDLYMERGGNFIDTANFYTGGTSETLLGKFLSGRRDNAVVATKYSLATEPGNPNAGGNHRRNMVRAVEASLRRLDTDYIDLYYLHVWDGLVPVEEVMRGFDDLVSAGKIVYAGISDTPAWQVARMQTLADLRGWAPLVALQIEHSLIERTVEHDLLPMAHELGLGVLAWSPLGSGVLSGKYTREDIARHKDADPWNGTRAAVAAGMGALSEHNLDIVDVLRDVAEDVGHTVAQTAIAWLMARQMPTVIPIIGARTAVQFEENLAALEVTLSEAHVQRLDEASAIAPVFPHSFLPKVLPQVFGGQSITRPR